MNEEIYHDQISFFAANKIGTVKLEKFHWLSINKASVVISTKTLYLLFDIQIFLKVVLTLCAELINNGYTSLAHRPAVEVMFSLGSSETSLKYKSLDHSHHTNIIYVHLQGK